MHSKTVFFVCVSLQEENGQRVLVFTDCNLDGAGDASQLFVYLPDNGQWLSKQDDQSCIEGKVSFFAYPVRKAIHASTTFLILCVHLLPDFIQCPLVDTLNQPSLWLSSTHATVNPLHLNHLSILHPWLILIWVFVLVDVANKPMPRLVSHYIP